MMIKINPVKNYFVNITRKNISFSSSVCDTFEKRVPSVKYVPACGNNTIRLNFEKDFFSDKHCKHGDGWIIKEDRAGNNHVFTAYNPKNHAPQEIRVYGKKGKIIKDIGNVAKNCKLSTKPNNDGMYLSKEYSIKRNDGSIGKAILKYEWIEPESKMFLSGIEKI